MCATWVSQIIGAVPGIQHGESRVTTVGPYSPNVAMSIRFKNIIGVNISDDFFISEEFAVIDLRHHCKRAFYEFIFPFPGGPNWNREKHKFHH